MIKSKSDFLSRQMSTAIQAVGVLMMVFHHLFGFPDRIGVAYIPLHAGIELLIARCCKVCVTLFAFCSGYGMEKKAAAMKQPSLTGLSVMSLKQIWGFLVRYWTVFLIFVPMGFLLGVYQFDPVAFLAGFLGLSNRYNLEWWYVGFYLLFLLCFPLLRTAAKWVYQTKPALLHVLFAGCLLAFALCPAEMPGYQFLLYLICFAEGMYFARFPLFSKLHERLPRGIGGFALLLVGAGAVAAFWVLKLPSILLAPAVIFILVCLLRPLLEWKPTAAVLHFFGKQSLYIWLTHTFFAYYYFQKLVFVPRFSPAIYLWCILLCIPVSMTLQWLSDTLLRLIPLRKKERTAHE